MEGSGEREGNLFPMVIASGIELVVLDTPRGSLGPSYSYVIIAIVIDMVLKLCLIRSNFSKKSSEFTMKHSNYNLYS